MRSRSDALPLSGTPGVRLDAGRTLRLPVAAGTVLVARVGRLRVAGPPRWLAERMVVADRELAEGQAHVVDDAGWVEVGAVGTADAWLHRIDPAPASDRARAWLRRLARRRVGPAPAR